MGEISNRYSFGETADGLKGKDPESLAKNLDEGDLAFLAQTGRYFNRCFALALRGKLVELKDAYDNEGGINSEKPPFPLRNIKNQNELDILLSNISMLGTTQGCKGACADRCGLDAFPTKDIIQIPLAQKKKLFDDTINAVCKVNRDPEFVKSFIRQLMLYGDNDALSDTDIYELMAYLYEKFGATPVVSTTLPEGSHDAFKRLASDSRQHLELEDLRSLLNEYDETLEFVRLWTEEGGNLDTLYKHCVSINNLNQLEIFLKRLEYYYETRDAGESDLKGYMYDSALEYFGLGTTSDFLDADGPTAMRRVSDIISSEKDKNSKYEKNEKQLDVLRYAAYTFGEEFVEMLRRFTGTEGKRSLEEEVRQREEGLKGKPYVQDIMVTNIGENSETIKEFKKEGKYNFLERVREDFKVAGKKFFDSGENDSDEFGIMNDSGIQFTPLAVFNYVYGFKSHDYPQGRIFVPFKGLTANSRLAVEGQDLGELLTHVIVLNGTVKIEDLPKRQKDVFVFDGDSRVRKITYDGKNYKVISDKVVKEGIRSIKDIEEFMSFHGMPSSPTLQSPPSPTS